MNSPAITVLLPAYNAAPYLRAAVDSVLAQTFRDFELLLIDDGSTDDTAAVLRSFSDPRIRVISRPNKGLVASLNEGLAAARAPLIARFDADDVCYPDRLAQQLAYLNAHPDCVIVGGDADYMDEDGVPLFTFRCKAHDDAGIRKQVWTDCPLIHSAVLFRKDAVLKAGGYDADALTFEDHLLWRNLLALGTAANLPDRLIIVRFNAASATVDERWRGPVFKAIKLRSIQAGRVSPADAETLRQLIKSQDFAAFKAAAYHSMIGKKYLWNNPKPALARKHLRQAIQAQPRKPVPYLLYALTFLPSRWVQAGYARLRQPPSS